MLRIVYVISGNAHASGAALRKQSSLCATHRHGFIYWYFSKKLMICGDQPNIIFMTLSDNRWS